MKITGTILLIGMICLSLNRFAGISEDPVQVTEVSCQMDCCASHQDCDQEEGSGDTDHLCPLGCDCSCCFQVAALEFRFLTIAQVAPPSVQTATYTNSYRFDFYNRLFQPPRFS